MIGLAFYLHNTMWRSTEVSPAHGQGETCSWCDTTHIGEDIHQFLFLEGVLTNYFFLL